GGGGGTPGGGPQSPQAAEPAHGDEAGDNLMAGVQESLAHDARAWRQAVILTAWLREAGPRAAGAGLPGAKAGQPQHHEGEVWRGPSGHYFTIKNHRVVPAPAPGAARGGGKAGGGAGPGMKAGAKAGTKGGAKGGGLVDLTPFQVAGPKPAGKPGG